MRPYLALDCETSGLNRQLSEVLELGYCFDDFKTPIGLLPSANIIVDNPVWNYSESYAMQMNIRLIQAQNNKDVAKVHPKETFSHLFEATRYAADKAALWDEEQSAKETDPANRWKPLRRVSIAGKNASVFDIPVLTAYFMRKEIAPNILAEWQSYLHYKYIDVGSVYYSRFGYIPSLSEINKLTGRNEVSHKAIDDALDVVYAVRYSLGVPYDSVI